MAITRHTTKVAAEATGGQIVWVFATDGKNWEARTDSDVYEDLRPTVTKWQFIQACVDAGITEAQLETAVALMTPKRKRFWAHTGKLDRDNPFSSGLRTNLTPNPTPKEWNAIFLAASELDFSKV